MDRLVLNTILQIAVILLLTNTVRPLSIKIGMPPVISLIVLGIIIGPSLINFVDKTRTIEWIAETGVLFLIFNAGIETNVKSLRYESKKAVGPAFGGVIIPFGAGFLLSFFYGFQLITCLMVGSIFTATSISVSLMTLIDIDKFNSIEGRCIVNSAILDDIIGIVILSLILSISLHSELTTAIIEKTVGIAVLKISLFFIMSYFIGRYVILNLYINSKKLDIDTTILSLSVAVIFIYSWLADLLGLAAIIGAFVSGLILGQTEFKEKIFSGITTLGNSFFIDIFFVSIGLGLNLKTLTFKPIYQLLFILLAIVSKLIGGSLGALVSRFDIIRSIRIGIGMIPRGEVALIVASLAFHRNLIDSDVFSTTIMMVIATSIITPILIKKSYSWTKKDTFNL